MLKVGLSRLSFRCCDCVGAVGETSSLQSWKWVCSVHHHIEYISFNANHSVALHRGLHFCVLLSREQKRTLPCEFCSALDESGPEDVIVPMLTLCQKYAPSAESFTHRTAIALNYRSEQIARVLELSVYFLESCMGSRLQLGARENFCARNRLLRFLPQQDPVADKAGFR